MLLSVAIALALAITIAILMGNEIRRAFVRRVNALVLKRLTWRGVTGSVCLPATPVAVDASREHRRFLGIQTTTHAQRFDLQFMTFPK